MSKLDEFSDLDDLHLLEGLSLQEIEELSEAIDPEVRYINVEIENSDKW